MRFLGFISRHKILFGVILGMVILAFSIRWYNLGRQAKEQDKVTEKVVIENNTTDEENVSTADTMLMGMQPELMKKYGKVPDGYIWDSDGSLLSLGDKSMTAEEVVYAYLRGLSSLDISTAQRYSRDSKVVQTYNGYYDDKNKNTDYTDQFERGMYTQSLLSLQVEGVKSTAVFAENKQVFSVKVKMLDLTDKNFWTRDKKEIYDNLYTYNLESDSTKADIYLYDYILDYYESGEAELRDVTFDITVQRYPDLDSGWLVSVDTDVDDACMYKDGNLVVSYIKERYNEEGKELVEEGWN